MGTILVSYDTESGAVGEGLAQFGDLRRSPYRFALDPTSAEEALELMTDVHGDVGVPGTVFICGKTLLHGLGAVQEAQGTGLLDVQQHTYSHLPLREVSYEPEPGVIARIAEPPAVALREELAFTSRLIRDHLGHDCVGLRPPFGYHRGLRGRADLLDHVRAAGIRYVTSWGRNERGLSPTPLEVQPFAYADEGFPEILELPFQFFIDGIWFDQHGWDRGDDYRRALERVVDEVAERNLVFGACFHDWALLASDERRVGWLRGFLAYAKKRVAVMTYTEYWRDWTAREASG